MSPVNPDPLGNQGTISQGFPKPQTAQIFTLCFMTVAKLQLGSSNKNNFMAWESPQHEDLVLTGPNIRKVANHCSKISFSELPSSPDFFSPHPAHLAYKALVNLSGHKAGHRVL